MLERIDHTVCVVPELSPVAASYELLGLSLTPESRHVTTGAANRTSFVGTDATNASYLELLSVFDAETAHRSGRSHFVEAAARGGGMVGLSFGVSDIEAISSRLPCAATSARPGAPSRGWFEGLRRAWVENRRCAPVPRIGRPVPGELAVRFDRSKAAGRFDHTFP